MKDPDPMLGRTLGGCRLERPLGAGGGGQVYAAHHLRLGQAVAVKVIRPSSVSETALARFQREARAAARIGHPNVARIQELGSENGVWFIVQELVPGESLEVRVERNGPLLCEEVLRLGAAIASGLHAIHEAAIVHRDVKPENVVLTPGGESKLVDFGVALDLEANARITQAGLFVGTPAYMAPEQLDQAPTGPAADVFGLGGVLHFALTGRAPHETGADGSVFTLIARRTQVSLTPDDIAALRPDAPGPVTQLLAELLALDPGARPTALQAGQRLLALRLARGAPAAQRAGSTPRRGPRVAAAALTVAALVSGVVLALLLRGAPEPSAVRPTESVSGSPALTSEGGADAERARPPQATPVDSAPPALGDAAPVTTVAPPAEEPLAPHGVPDEFDALLSDLEALRLDEANRRVPALVARVDVPREELAAALELKALLDALNDDAPLPPATVAAVASWPPSVVRARAAWASFGEGLPRYATARAALDRWLPRLAVEDAQSAPLRVAVIESLAALRATPLEPTFLLPARRTDLAGLLVWAEADAMGWAGFAGMGERWLEAVDRALADPVMHAGPPRRYLPFLNDARRFVAREWQDPPAPRVACRWAFPRALEGWRARRACTVEAREWPFALVVRVTGGAPAIINDAVRVACADVGAVAVCVRTALAPGARLQLSWTTDAVGPGRPRLERPLETGDAWQTVVFDVAGHRRWTGQLVALELGVEPAHKTPVPYELVIDWVELRLVER